MHELVLALALAAAPQEPATVPTPQKAPLAVGADEVRTRVARAADWLVREQRPDGAWGVGAIDSVQFTGFAVETYYAFQLAANALGFILILFGLLGETVNTMWIRRRMTDLDPWAVTWIRLLTGAAILVVITALFGEFSFEQVTPAGYFSLFWAALIGALGGQLVAFYITHRFSATAFSLTSYLVPVAATGFGLLFLDEIVTCMRCDDCHTDLDNRVPVRCSEWD